MTPDRTVTLATAVVVAVVVVASGPLVPGLDLTPETDDADLGYRGFGQGATGMGVEKRLAFGSLGLPGEGELRPTDGGYRLELGPARLPLETGSRPVTVRYAVRIPALQFAEGTVTTVPARTGRTVRVESPTGTVPADRVTEGAYTATLVVSVEQGDWVGTAAEETVVVEVGR